MRRRTFGNIASLALTFVVLGVIEVSLRTAGVPQRGTLFVRHGKEIRLAPGAAARYFAARSPLVPETHSEAFSDPKPAGTVRVICLGGSTMAGYPFTYNGTLPSLLADRLTHLFPDTSFEVLNFAVSAVGSFTVLDMCRHALRYQPDIVVIYTGHNEFYGALGVGSAMRSLAPRWLTLLHLRMQDVACYRWCWDTLGRVRRPGRTSSAGETLMAQMVGDPCIPTGSRAYHRALSTFCANIRAACRSCVAGGVPVVVCELVANLRDQPPFSVCPPAGSSAQTASLHAPSAQEVFRQARAAEAKGEIAQARFLYERARDGDQCRFRAPGEFNDSLRTIVPREGGLLVPLVERFQAASLFSAPGYDLFIDHLHPNLEGYLSVATALTETIRDGGLLVPPDRWPSDRELPAGAYRELALVTQLEHAIAVDKVRRLMAHWPFSPDQPAPIHMFDDSIAALARRYHDERLSWSDVHLKAADYLIRRGAFTAALRETQAVLKQAVGFWPAWLKAGDVYLAQGRPLDAADAYRTASRLDGGQGHSMAKLGSALLAARKPEEAIPVLVGARRDEAGLSETDRCRAGYMLGLAYVELGRIADAERMEAELRREGPGAVLAERLENRIRGRSVPR
ncbi:MAG: GDSL-type esterase/lipase family protein [Candidatus Eisenbacteria bacterium]|nr:GDSL-type esterase/lipase family protein [Candidatus Eisenbacteria bacterium]